MYHLHFNESTQKFYIIPSGVTITEAIHGESIAGCSSLSFLRGFVRGMVHPGINMKYSVDQVKLAVIPSSFDADILVD